MNTLINVGFGNMVASSKIVAIVSPDASPVKRLIQSARENNRCVDATQGRKTKAVLVMEPDYIVLSALVPDTLSKRFLSDETDTDEM